MQRHSGQAFWALLQLCSCRAVGTAPPVRDLWHTTDRPAHGCARICALRYAACARPIAHCMRTPFARLFAYLRAARSPNLRIAPHRRFSRRPTARAAASGGAIPSHPVPSRPIPSHPALRHPSSARQYLCCSPLPALACLPFLLRCPPCDCSVSALWPHGFPSVPAARLMTGSS